MKTDALQTIKRSHKRALFLAVVLAVVTLVSIGLFAFQVYQYPSKFAFALSAFLVAALALTYRYGFYLPMKREESRFGLTSNQKRK